jgi:hypothetical protein
MPANIQELTVALSKTAQTAIDVPSGDLVRFNTTSDDLADWMPVVEDDADEIGKGHEFAEETFLTSYKVTKKSNATTRPKPSRSQPRSDSVAAMGEPIPPLIRSRTSTRSNCRG